MANDVQPHLRLFCICGQKMKVSGKMFGRPGKCVACSQKIRIPSLDEIPEGTEEISLKDHPEFLRKVKKRSRSKQKAKSITAPPASNPVKLGTEENKVFTPGTQDANDVVSLGDEQEHISTVPLDVLEPLRLLCSLEQKLNRKRSQLGDIRSQDEESKRSIDEQLDTVHIRRSDLDDQLRQVLMEVAIELAGTLEKIVHTTLSARVGETLFDTYLETIDRLRRRRDRLERRQQNLRGWLATYDPHYAGGYIDVSFDDLPPERHSISLPQDNDESDTLLSSHLASIREAFVRRSQAERKLAEMERMDPGTTALDDAYRDARAATKAEHAIADEGIAFVRERLRQLFDDYETEVETFDALHDLATGRLQTQEISRAQFDVIEKNLRRERATAAKARTLIRRTLNANSSQDVPEPRGTLISRLGAAGRATSSDTDTWVVRFAAIAMGVSVFLPVLGRHSLAFNARDFVDAPAALRLAFLIPLVYGVTMALFSSVESKSMRARLMALVWILATAAGVYVFHQTQLGIDSFSNRFRQEGAWFLRPAMAVILVAHFAMLYATCKALYAIRRDRALAPLIPITGILLSVVIATDAFHFFLPVPKLVASVESGDSRHMILNISNRGRSTLHVMRSESTARGAYTLTIEKSIGPNSWEPVTESALSGTARVSNSLNSFADIHPRSSRLFDFDLDPGRYQVTLTSSAFESEFTQEVHLFDPDPIVFEEIVTTIEPEPEVPVEEEEAPAPLRNVDLSGVPEVRLSGIMEVGNNEPKFSFVLYFDDGREHRTILARGDTLFSTWTVTESNTQLKTVTLSEGSNILVVRTGDRVRLAVP